MVEFDLALAEAVCFEGVGFSVAEAAVFVGVRFRADGGGGGVYLHCRQRVPLAFFGGG